MGNESSKQDSSAYSDGKKYDRSKRATIHGNPIQAPQAPPPYSPVDPTHSNFQAAQGTPRAQSNLPRRSATLDSRARPPAPSANRAATVSHRRAATVAQADALTENPHENDLLLLSKFDTAFLVDDSGSMQGERWIEARNALAGVAEIATRYDSDGVDVCFLNDETEGKGIKSAADVEQLFDMVSPNGFTPTGERLEMLLLEYLEKLDAAYAAFAAGDRNAKKSVKPLNLIVITDGMGRVSAQLSHKIDIHERTGAASDDPEYVIVNAAKRMDTRRFPLSQVGIQFVQIGDDPAATAALNRLDDGLSAKHGIRDIVDTVPFGKHGGRLTAEILTNILLGGINRRYDSRLP